MQITKQKKQGGIATANGQMFEKHIEKILQEAGYIQIQKEEFETQTKLDRFYIKQIAYQKRKGGRGKTEFLMFTRDAVDIPEFSAESGLTLCRIECKYQSSAGSVEDKINTSIERMFRMSEQKRSILIISGKGITPSARYEISEKIISTMLSSPRGGPEIAAVSAQMFRTMLMEMNQEIMVTDRECLNGRLARDGTSPKHDRIEWLKQELMKEQNDVYGVTPSALYDHLSDPEHFVTLTESEK